MVLDIPDVSRHETGKRDQTDKINQGDKTPLDCQSTVLLSRDYHDLNFFFVLFNEFIFSLSLSLPILVQHIYPDADRI